MKAQLPVSYRLSSEIENDVNNLQTTLIATPFYHPGGSWFSPASERLKGTGQPAARNAQFDVALQDSPTIIE